MPVNFVNAVVSGDGWTGDLQNASDGSLVTSISQEFDITVTISAYFAKACYTGQIKMDVAKSDGGDVFVRLFVQNTDESWTEIGNEFSPLAATKTWTFSEQNILQYRITAYNDSGLNTFIINDSQPDDQTPAAGKATTPDPATASTGVALTKVLGWTNGANTATVNVYFGTAATPVTKVIDFDLAVSYDPTIANGITYYWRVDTINWRGDVTTGDVWSFTTIAAGAGRFDVRLRERYN
jgi:hypothetical protein